MLDFSTPRQDVDAHRLDVDRVVVVSGLVSVEAGQDLHIRGFDCKLWAVALIRSSIQKVNMSSANLRLD